MRIAACGSLCVVVLLGACASGVEETVLPSALDYRCAGGKVLRVARAPDGRQAAFVHDGRWITLARADSAAQEKYASGGLALYLDGERAVVEQDGRVLYGPCQSATPLPTAPRRTY